MKKNSIFFSVFLILNILCPFLNGFFGSLSQNIVVENKAGEICYKTNKFSNNKIIYTQTTINKINSGSNEIAAKQYYSVSYGYNNHTKWMRQTVVCGSGGSFAEFSICCNGVEYPHKTAIIDAVGYVNNNKRFESLDIGLYWQKTRVEELSFDQSKYDGIVYLPDFYCDFLLKTFNFATYEELVASEYPIQLHYNKGEQDLVRNYKIANIINVSGFAGNGNSPTKLSLVLNDFLGCFVVTPDSYFYINDQIGAICLGMIQPKKYCLIQYFYVMNNYLSNYSIDGQVCYSTDNDNVVCSKNFINKISPENYSRNSFVPVVSLISSLLLVLVFYYFALFKTNLVFLTKKHDFSLIISISVLALIVELICRIISLNMVFTNILLFFNNFFFATIIVELVVCALYLIIKRKRL